MNAKQRGVNWLTEEELDESVAEKGDSLRKWVEQTIKQQEWLNSRHGKEEGYQGKVAKGHQVKSAVAGGNDKWCTHGTGEWRSQGDNMTGQIYLGVCGGGLYAIEKPDVNRQRKPEGLEMVMKGSKDGMKLLSVELDPGRGVVANVAFSAVSWHG